MEPRVPAARSRRARVRHAITQRFAVPLLVLAVLGLGAFVPAEARTAPTAPAGAIEAETMSGPSSVISDSGATNGTAVATTGELDTTPGLSAGSYRYTVRVKGAGGRLQLLGGGQPVGEMAAPSTWTSITVPLWLTGPADTVGLRAIAPPGGSVSSLDVDWVALGTGPSGYSTRGNHIVDPAGASFVPRGVNRQGLEQTTTGYYLTDWDAAVMAGWGASVVRVPLAENFWVSTSCAYDAGYPATVDAEVNRINANGMVALLDLHWSTTGRRCGVSGQQKLADSMSVTFWQQVAARYKDNPRVAFDLYNEPHDVTPAVWRNGGLVDGWQAVGMQKLYDTVRASGATNLVFVSGLRWALDLNPALTNPLDGYGIVYAPHAYCLDCGGALAGDIDAMILPAAARYPVAVTEFGYTSPDGSYDANLIAYAEAHGLGWLAWMWSAAPVQGYGILDAWDSYQPNVVGLPVRDGLWAARGWHSYWGQ